jgi:hypothetical protein
MVKLCRWIDTNEDDIARTLVERHWPATAGAIE